jgi:hypothetical protein
MATEKTGKELIRKTALGKETVDLEPTFRAGDAALAKGAEQFRGQTAANLVSRKQLGQGTAEREAQAGEVKVLGAITERERVKELARTDEEIRQQGRRDTAAGQLATLEEAEAGREQQGEQFEATQELEYKKLDITEEQFDETMGFNRDQLQLASDQFDQKLDFEKTAFEWEQEVTSKGIDQQDMLLALKAAEGDPIAMAIIMKEIYAEAGLEFTEEDYIEMKNWAEKEQAIIDKELEYWESLLDSLNGGDDTEGEPDNTTVIDDEIPASDDIGITDERLDETEDLAETLIPLDIERGVTTLDEIMTTMEDKDWNNLSDVQIEAMTKIDGVEDYASTNVDTPSLYTDEGFAVINNIPYTKENPRSEEISRSTRYVGGSKDKRGTPVHTVKMKMSIEVTNLMTGKTETIEKEYEYEYEGFGEDPGGHNVNTEGTLSSKLPGGFF